jgi:hypothetical protein
MSNQSSPGRSFLRPFSPVKELALDSLSEQLFCGILSSRQQKLTILISGKTSEENC